MKRKKTKKLRPWPDRETCGIIRAVLTDALRGRMPEGFVRIAVEISGDCASDLWHVSYLQYAGEKGQEPKVVHLFSATSASALLDMSYGLARGFDVVQYPAKMVPTP